MAMDTIDSKRELKSSRCGGNRSESGVALIIVLLMIGIIIGVTVQLVRSSRSEYYDASNMRDRFKTVCLAKSGFYRAQTFLAQDDNNYDALFEKWAQSEAISAQASSLFDDGYFKVSIEDESGKIPINKLVVNNDFNQPVKDLLIRLLTQPDFKLEAAQITAIVNTIKDYLDADMEATGAEQGTGESVNYKNGPLDSLEELLLIKGISEELFYGTKEKPGISAYLTIYGDGRVNINTAPRLVLKSLSAGLSDDQVTRIEDFRKTDNRDLADPGWYHRIIGTSGINIATDLITVRSRVYRIVSTGYLGKMTQTVTGIVEKGEDPKAMKILSWKIS